MQDLYCKVYIDTDDSFTDLFERVLSYTKGEKDAITYINSEWCEISVRRNREFDQNNSRMDVSDFVFWKFFLDIEPANNIGETVYIYNISRLVEFLKGIYGNVVIACDFEDEIM